MESLFSKKVGKDITNCFKTEPEISEIFSKLKQNKLEIILKIISQIIDNHLNQLSDGKTQYGFFVSLDMNMLKATKNWRKFIQKCTGKDCFIFERICCRFTDKNFIEMFSKLYYVKKENFSENNTEFLIFCKTLKDFEELTKFAEKLRIDKILEIVSFDYESMRDLPTEKQMQEELSEEYNNECKSGTFDGRIQF